MTSRMLLAGLLAVASVGLMEGADSRMPRRSPRGSGSGVADSYLVYKVDSERAIVVSTAEVALPYVINGGGYRSTFRLSNMEAKEVEYQLLFINDNGRAATVEMADGTLAASVKGKLAAFGSATVMTSGMGDEAQIVWSFLSTGGSRVGIMSSVEESVDGTFLGVTYPASSLLLKKAVGLYDNVGSDTEISVVNFGTVEVTVTAVVRNESGEEIFKEEFQMPSLGATAYYPVDAVEAAKGARGSVEFSVPAAGRAGIGVLSGRFYDAGGYEMLPSLSLP